MSDCAEPPPFPGVSPLLTVDEVSWWFGDGSCDAIIARIREGKLRAVDISRDGEKARRHDYRIFRHSIERRQLVQQSGGEPIVALLPQNRTKLRLDEVSRLLNCTRRHVSNLAIDGADSTGIPMAALVAFLSAREVKFPKKEGGAS